MAKRKTDSEAVAIARDDGNNTQTPIDGNGGTSVTTPEDDNPATPINGNGGTPVTTPEDNNSTETNDGDDDLNAKLNTALNALKEIDGLIADGVALPKLTDEQYEEIQTILKAFAGDVKVETWTK